MFIQYIDQRIVADLPYLQRGWQVVSAHHHVLNLRPNGRATLLALVDDSVPFAPRQLRCQTSLPKQLASLQTLLSQLSHHPPTTFDCSLRFPNTVLNRTALAMAWQYLVDIKTTPPDTFNQQLQSYLQFHIHAVLEALDNHDAQLERAVQALVGLGQGLTPSGDDFLMGLLIALRLPSSPFACQYQRLQQAVQHHRHRTHPISAAFLDDAIHMQISAPMQACIMALHQAVNNSTDAAIQSLTHLGHRSGYDLLSGLLAGLPHDATQRILLCPYH